MSGRRAVLLTAGAGVATVGICLLLLLTSLDGIVRRAIESRGSALTGTAVRLADVALAIGEGRLTIRNLRVANPPGYAAPDAFVLAEATVTLSLTSLLVDPIHIHTVRVQAPQMFYEVDAQGRANVDVIRKAMKHRQRGDVRRADDRTGNRRPSIVDVLTLRDGKAHVDR